jgi:hypothetical protein
MTPPTARPAPVDGAVVDRALTGFYAVVALIALAGQAGAAVHWLGWWLPSAVAAVAAVEFGGIALSAYADFRRRLGERALAARILSAAVAGGAVAVNWFGHPDRMQAGFFAGMSALGYLVWLLHSGARRRDQLRAIHALPPVAPAYGLGLWLRHPGLTRRARALALADPTLGLYGSLDAARAAQRVERRQAAIATALRRKLTAAVDPLTAEIATATFDLDEIAARLAAGADYDGLTALIATDLAPNRLTGGKPARTPSARTTPTRPAAGSEAGTTTSAGRPARTGTGRAGRTGTRTDADLIAALADVPRETDGTVPVRRAAAALGTGPDRARRLLAAAGLLRTTPVPASTETPAQVDVPAPLPVAA